MLLMAVRWPCSEVRGAFHSFRCWCKISSVSHSTCRTNASQMLCALIHLTFSRMDAMGNGLHCMLCVMRAMGRTNDSFGTDVLLNSLKDHPSSVMAGVVDVDDGVSVASKSDRSER